ncbi:putative regulator of Ras-like GTPase activity (Roadblock/LC7/MglB family) [Allocatelliglobosispora scoriae]|uniref:Putative regulator of Ras-like GTPase activity (Roadblock/LC7/MglB family) n=1 Tax=Allocatelliglobosispora scoriae TaxID=643052 RepID=A0A841C149_9ACTN|nr:VCBS repeat-containing protein [Allocatelliglobosispora scoriae]MBB5872782.1 putative regulator of Ras-like GTPase activity (Roadblock/LC7/MglB family) [Allocatelliglobosispora scoriae]
MHSKLNRRLAGLSAVLVALVAAGSAPARADVVVPANPTSIPAVLSGDFSGDGFTDLALTGASGWTSLPVATRNYQGGFNVTNAVSPAFAAWASLPGVKVITADFNGDHADDILLTGVAGWTGMPLALSNRNGTFTVTTASVGSSGFAALAAAATARAFSGDFNGDGRTDIALTAGDGWSTIPIAYSAGNGTFTFTNSTVPTFPSLAWGTGTRLFSGDVNADGRTDLVLLPGDADMLTDLTVTVAISNGNGTFQVTRTDFPDFVGATYRKQVVAGDFTGDHRMDLAVVQNDRILMAYSTGTGTFYLYRTGGAGDAAFRSRALRPGASIISADYDCDGRADLAVLPEPGSSWTTMPVAMPRDPETLFIVDDLMPHFPQWAATAGAKVVVGDFDDDDCYDLALVGNAGSTAVTLAMSNGDGSFNEQNAGSPTFAAWATGTSPVTLPPAPTPTTGNLSILDTAVLSGIQPSMTVGTDGLGIASYWVGGSEQNLRVAHCVDVLCTAITTTDIDTVGDVGQFSSIRIGSDGLPLISYIANRNAANAFIEDLRVAHCNDIACTSATVTTIDAAAKVNDVSPLGIGGDGLGLISYQDTTTSSATRMKVAHCTNIACTASTVTTIDTVKPDNGENGGYSQNGLAIGNHGLGLISYYDGGTNEMLKVAACLDPACATVLRTVVDRAANPSGLLHGGWSSMTIGRDGLALISYNGNYSATGSDLKVAHCRDAYCTTSTLITADTGGHTGWRSSITIGGDGLGVISYHDITNRDLKVAHCTNLACSAATAALIDGFDDVGTRSSITVGPDGLPLIGYTGPGLIGVALRVIRCGNSDCTAVIVAPF